MADLPKPALIVTVTGRLVETEPTALTFDLPEGRHELCTADQLDAYAAAKVAEERERWLRATERADRSIRMLEQRYMDLVKSIADVNAVLVRTIVISANDATAIRGTEGPNA